MEIHNNSQQWYRYIIKWLVLLLAFFSYLMGFVVRFSWPPIIAEAAPELGIDMTRAGLYMSAFYLGYVLTHIPAGFLSDRFGVRFIIAAAMLIEGISSLGMAHIDSFGSGFVLRVFSGLGAGAVYASCVRSVTTWFGPKERGTAFGCLMIAPTAGVLVANQIASMVLVSFPWQTIFNIVGISAITLGIFVAVFMKETGVSTKGVNFKVGLCAIVGNKNILRMAFAGFWFMFLEVGFISWSNTALKEGGLSFANAGFVMTFFGYGGIVGPLVSGFLADRIIDKKMMFILGLIMLSPMVFLFGQLHSLITLAIAACGLGFVFGYVNTLLPLMISEYSGPQWSASAGGITGCVFQSGAIFGPAILGLSVDITGSFHLVWLLLAVAPAVALLFLLKLTKPMLVS